MCTTHSIQRAPAANNACKNKHYQHALVYDADDGVELCLHGVPKPVQLPQGPLLGCVQVTVQGYQAGLKCPSALLFCIDKVNPLLCVCVKTKKNMPSCRT